MKKELSLFTAENLISGEKGLATLLNEMTNFSYPEAVQNLIEGVTVTELGTITPSVIMGFGFSKSMAQKLKTSIDFALKLHSVKMNETFTVGSPEDAFKAVAYLQYEDQEKFVVLALNTKRKILARREVFVGSLNASLVHPREVLSFAIKHNAAAIVVAHNHPSLDPFPSREDREVTSRLKEAGDIIGIELLDHIIVGGSKFVSLKDRGHI